MRFLGIGDYCDLSALYMHLLAEGHDVKVHIAKDLCRSTLAGLVTQVPDWQAELPWLRAVGPDGFILFENTADNRGELQDALRRDGFQVIGGSAYGDRLENDRAYAQRVLQGIGLPISPVYEFSDRTSAIEFLQQHPGRYVLKFNAPIEGFVGRLQDGRDVRAFLAGRSEISGHERSTFILTPHIDGVEMGVGGYFNGDIFLKPSCLDWEHKRFFPGNLGELTGEMGTVVTYERTQRFHDLTLGRMEPLLREGGYCGYINLNTIVNEQGIWPLEFTCRFGYPGYAILDPLQETSWGELFHAMTSRSQRSFATRAGYAVGIVMTTPPFPYARPAIDVPVGLPIIFDDSVTADERRHIHFGEVGMHDGQLVTSGAYGWTMVVTGVAPTVAAAQARANRLADRIYIPDARYRRDIGDGLISGGLDRVERLGLRDPA